MLMPKPRIWKRPVLPGWCCAETYLSPVIGRGITPEVAYWSWYTQQQEKMVRSNVYTKVLFDRLAVPSGA
jgi:hypothetical protein